MEKIFHNMISKKEFTTNQLHQYGLHTKELTDLIIDGTLIRIKKGYYQVCSIDGLFDYGKKLMKMGKQTQAILCFHLCYEVNPTHFNTCFLLFLISIIIKDYKKMFQYFEQFYQSDDPYKQADHNFYLYLLSMITTLPKKHIEYNKFLEFKQIRVDFNNPNYENIELQNKMRGSVFSQRFGQAMKEWNELIEKSNTITIHDVVIKTMLEQALEEKYRKQATILELIEMEHYEQLYFYLQEVKSKHPLCDQEFYILKLTEVLLNIQNTKEIPIEKKRDCNNLYEAILSGNYPLALSMAYSFSKKIHISLKDNPIYLLLSDIMIEIEKQKGNIDVDENDIKIFKLLRNQDMNEISNFLREYLRINGQDQYKSLILNLINVSLEKHDFLFLEPLKTLKQIIEGTYQFHIASYIEQFYEALSSHEFRIAKQYLNILSDSKLLGQPCTLLENMEKVYKKTRWEMNQNQ